MEKRDITENSVTVNSDAQNTNVSTVSLEKSVNMQQEAVVQREVSENIAVEQATSQNTYTQQPVNQQPMGQNPYVQQSVNQQPMGQNPYAQQPVNQQPMGQNPYAQQPVNQQPMGQNPYAQQPINQQPMGQNPYAQQGNVGMSHNLAGNNPQNKKSKKGLIFAIIFVIIIAAIATVGVLIAQGKLSIGASSAEKKLEKSQKLFQEEMSSYSAGIEEKLDMDAMSKYYDENPVHYDFDLVADVPNGESAGVSFDAILDNKNNQGKVQLGVGSQGFNIDIGEIIVDSDALYVSIPLLKDEVYYIDLSNFKEDYSNSIWPEVLDLELPEDFEVESFANPGDAMKNAELVELSKKYTKKFKKIRTIELNGTPTEIAVGGELISCKGVTISCEKNELNSTFQSYWEEYMATEYCQTIIENSEDSSVEQILEEIGNITFEQDLVINVYFDSKGRIVNVSTPEKMQMTGFRIDGFSFDFSFSGDERATDNIDGKFYLYAGTESLYIKLARSAELTKNIYNDLWNISLGDDAVGDEVVMTYKNNFDKDTDAFNIELTAEMYDKKYAVTIDGAVTDIVKGESYTVDLDKIAVIKDDTEMLTMTATFKQGKATEDIEIPTDYIDVWEMKESDLQSENRFGDVG